MDTRIEDIACKVNDFCMDNDFYSYVDRVGMDSADIEKNKKYIEDKIRNNDIGDICKKLHEFDVESFGDEIKKDELIQELKSCTKDYDLSKNIKEGNLDKYMVTGFGEHGGLSTSLLAEDKTTNEKVFMKIVERDNMSIYEKCLISENNILHKLDKVDGIAKGIDFFEYNDKLYLVEKMIEGHSLKELLPTLNNAERQNVYKSILDTVKEIHKCGIVHRDLKPNNILIDKKGKVHIIDFNISKIIGERVNVISGNRRFSSPEQLSFNSIADTKDDVYALGKLYEYVFEKTNELSKMATEFDANDRCNLDYLITEFDKETIISSPVKYNQMSLATLIKEAKDKYQDVSSNSSKTALNRDVQVI